MSGTQYKKTSVNYRSSFFLDSSDSADERQLSKKCNISVNFFYQMDLSTERSVYSVFLLT